MQRFGTGTFKKCYAQLVANPKVEVLAVKGSEFMRYDGEVKFVKDDSLMAKVREIMPQIMAMYDKNGWELGLFHIHFLGAPSDPSAIQYVGRRVTHFLYMITIALLPPHPRHPAHPWRVCRVSRVQGVRFIA